MKKRNLFSIGAMRAGSTTIYHYLSQHPDIFIPHIKEPDFFIAEQARHKLAEGQKTSIEIQNLEYILNKGKYRTQTTYDSLYSNKEEFRYLADCSHYLHHPATAQLIYQYNPDAKILISLRNPTDRIYSEYMLYSRRGDLSEDFSEFIRKMLTKDGQHINTIAPDSRLEKGRYSILLRPWLQYFDKEQIKIIIFDELKSYFDEVCRDIYTWLGIDNTFKPEQIRAQRGGEPKSKILVHFFKSSKFLPPVLKKQMSASLRWKIRDFIYSKTLTRQNMSQEMELLLKELYLPSICELEVLLNKNFSKWK